MIRAALIALTLSVLSLCVHAQTPGTLNLTGPSTTPGAPQLMPQALNDAINAQLGLKADAAATAAAIAAAAATANAALPVTALPAALAAPPAIGGTTPAAGAFSNFPVNVLGTTPAADATGATDASTVINAALAQPAPNGQLRNVYLPAGTYHVAHSLNVGTATQGQCLIGDGHSTIIDVGPDFDPAALGVVVIAGQDPNAFTGTRPCVLNVRFVFHQPLDLTTTTTASSAAGTSTITVANPAGIVNGAYVMDVNSTFAGNPIQNALSTGVTTRILTTVSSVAGNVVTLSSPIINAGVGNGDTIAFAQPRANFASLGACSLTAGSPGCKYPWAIYGNGMGLPYIDNVLYQGAWNGMYLHGASVGGTNSFNIGSVQASAINVGLDIDNIANFPQIVSYNFWDFGYRNPTNGGFAFTQNYYDGQTVCASFGRTDGIAVGFMQCFAGKINISSTWTWGHFDQMMLDGLGASLNVAGGGSTKWVYIGTGYVSGGSAEAVPRISVTGLTTGCVTFGTLNVGTTSAVAPIAVSGGGCVAVQGGSQTQNTTSTPLATVTGSGSLLSLQGINFKLPALAWSVPLIQQSVSGSRIVFQSNTFNAGGSGTALSIGSDNQQNTVTGNNFNGWSFTSPGPLGYYLGNSTDPVVGLHRLFFVAPGGSNGNGADLTEDPLTACNYTIPANQLASVGDTIHVVAEGTMAASTDNKTAKVKFNGTPIGATVNTSAAAATTWRIDGNLTRIASGAQRWSSFNLGQAIGASVGGQNTSITDTATIALTITGQNATNAVANSVTCSSLTVDFMR
jgi:hypothetical protein